MLNRLPLPAPVRARVAAFMATPPVRLLTRLAGDITRDDVPGLAAEMAYRFLFALFPFLIFVAAVIGFVGTIVGYGNLFSTVMGFLTLAMPPQVQSVVSDWVTGVLSTQSTGLLTLGAAGSLWGASGGIGTLTKGLNRAYDVDENRPFWRLQLLSLITTLAMVVVTVGGVALYTFGGNLAEMAAGDAGAGDRFVAIWDAAQEPAVAVGLFAVLLFVYRELPNTTVTLRGAVPGAIVACLGWIGLTEGFSLYVSHFGSYDRTFGSLGAAVVLMLWMYMVGIVLLVGGEVNAAVGGAGRRAACQGTPAQTVAA